MSGQQHLPRRSPRALSTSRVLSTSPSRRPAGKAVALAAVVLIPLAFAGLFIGSFSQADTGIDRVPAAIVNSDELVNQTAPDGTETPVFAGRQLVTELTGSKNPGFDWTITNADDAEQALARGEVYAVLTVPKNFSASILSLQSSSPTTAKLTVRTDDSHSYLTAPVIDAVGQTMASTFGRTITEQYLTGVYSSIGGLGDSLGTAADGASTLASGATDLGGGIGQLATGASSAQSGASSLAAGIRTYTGGVRSLSSGLSRLNSGAAGLSQVTSGLTTYTAGVSQLSAGIAQASGQLNDADPTNDVVARGTLAALSGQLSQAAAGGNGLAASAGSGIQSVQGGIAQSASGAQRLAAGSAALTSGADSLAAGLGELSTGAITASSGAASLATGASQLSDGLRAGAAQIPATEGNAAADTAEIVAEPVVLTTDRDNEVSDIGQVLATFFVPLGLWIGALAIFLVMGPLSRNTLLSTAGSGRIVGRQLARASAIAVAQALLLVALLHLALGVDWSLLPATLGLSLVMAFAFTAFHQLLTIGFGRAGLVISLFLLAVQVTSTGGLYPIEVVATPFQVISPLLPLTYGVSGMQSIVSGANPADVVVGFLALLGFGVASALIALSATRRVRRARSLGLIAA